jgi:hypothetical protein
MPGRAGATGTRWICWAPAQRASANTGIGVAARSKRTPTDRPRGAERPPTAGRSHDATVRGPRSGRSIERLRAKSCPLMHFVKIVCPKHLSWPQARSITGSVQDPGGLVHVNPDRPAHTSGSPLDLVVSRRDGRGTRSPDGCCAALASRMTTPLRSVVAARYRCVMSETREDSIAQFEQQLDGAPDPGGLQRDRLARRRPRILRRAAAGRDQRTPRRRAARDRRSPRCFAARPSYGSRAKATELSFGSSPPFGHRHPRPGVRSVYEHAHRQFHGRFPAR